MQKEAKKISVWQLFCVLLLLRLTAEMVFPSGRFGYEGILSALTAELLRFLPALPVIIYSFRGNVFYRAIWKKSRFFGWVSAVITAGLLLVCAMRTVYFAAEFTQRCLLTDMSVWAMMLILAGFAVYASYNGAEAIARGGVIFLAAAAAATAVVILADIPYMRWRELPPPVQELFVSDTISRVSGGGEYLVFAAMLPHLKENRRGTGGMPLIFSALSAALPALLCVFFTLTLGEVYSIAEYPIAAAASLADIALLKRLDGFACAVWSLGAAFRAGVFLFSGYAVIRELVPVREKTAEGRTSP